MSGQGELCLSGQLEMHHRSLRECLPLLLEHRSTVRAEAGHSTSLPTRRCFSNPHLASDLSCCFLLPPAIYIWLLIGMTLDPFAPALVPILGQPLQAGMDQPFLAGSIREFWGCR